MERIYPGHLAGLEPHAIYDALDLPEGVGARPFVAINMVSTVDGKITMGGDHKKHKIGSALDRTLMRRLRVHFDAVLRGAETVRKSPQRPHTAPDLSRRREASGRPPQPLAVVASRSLDLPLESDFFTGSPQAVVLTTDSSPEAGRARVERVARLEVIEGDELDVARALGRLHARYGVRRLLVEGGAALNYAFFAAGAVDALFCTLAPKISGFGRDLTMVMGPEMIEPPPRLALRTLHHHEGEMFFHWSVPVTS